MKIVLVISCVTGREGISICNISIINTVKEKELLAYTYKDLNSSKNIILFEFNMYLTIYE